MDNYIKQISEALTVIEKHFYKAKGLLICIVLFEAIYYYAIIPIIGETLKMTIAYFFEPEPNQIIKLILYAGYLVIAIGVYIIWVVKRKIPCFSQGKVGVIFSSSNPEGLEQDLKKLQERVSGELKAKDLLNLIQIKTLPPNIKINEPGVALSVVKKAKATVLVWGIFERASSMGRHLTGFPEISFTYTHPSNVGMQFHEEIASSLIGRKWAFDQENEFVEKGIVANNIAQVALNIIGMAFLVSGYFEKAEVTLAILDADVERFRRNAITSPHMRSFCTNVRKNHVRAIHAQVDMEYKNNFKEKGIYKANPQDLERWNRKIMEALQLDGQDSRLYIMQAIFAFLSGKTKEAERASRKARKYAPRANPSPDFCLAFLCLYNDEFPKARSHYRIGFAKKGSTNPSFIVEIIEFIQQVLEEHPEKFQLHYALGLINEARFDPTVGIAEYVAFIERARIDPYYSQFIEEAETRLEGLKNMLPA